VLLFHQELVVMAVQVVEVVEVFLDLWEVVPVELEIPLQ
tara:strand:- start:317 stop:433 length:117 start_codon:yes stop_codon:yes gene_type:complete